MRGEVSSRDVINKYLGIRFADRGRDPEKGLDCYGLVKCVYRDFLKVELMDIEDYGRYWFLKGEDFFMRNYGRQFIQVDSPRMFDVALFNVGRGAVNHAGVVLDARRFIHANHAGVTVSKLTQRHWRERVVGLFRLKGKNG